MSAGVCACGERRSLSNVWAGDEAGMDEATRRRISAASTRQHAANRARRKRERERGAAR